MFWWKRDGDIDVVLSYVAALNARDADAMIAQLHTDIAFVDSHSYGFEGKEKCAEVVREFLRVASGFKMTVEAHVRHGQDILVRGFTQADDPRMATDRLWKIRVKNGRISFWQNFGEADGPSLSHLLFPQKEFAQIDAVSQSAAVT